MKKILIALTASALMMVNVSAVSIADEKMSQAAQKLQELVIEAKKAGLSQQETLGLVAQGLEQDALLDMPQLTTQQKEALMYFGLGLVGGAVIFAGIWAIKSHFFGEKTPVVVAPSTPTTNPVVVVSASVPAVATPASTPVVVAPKPVVPTPVSTPAPTPDAVPTVIPTPAPVLNHVVDASVPAPVAATPVLTPTATPVIIPTPAVPVTTPVVVEATPAVTASVVEKKK